MSRRVAVATSVLSAALALAPAAHAQSGEAQAPDPAPAPAPAPDPASAPGPASASASAPASADTPRPWRFTGTVGVVSLPRPLSLELLARYRREGDPRWDLFAVGAAIEYLPPGIAQFGEDTKFQWLQAGLEGRWFPWRFLFVGARVGWQSASCCDTIKYTSNVNYTTTAFVLGPKVGALYTFPSGLTIGGELGAGIPIGADTTLDSDGQTDSNARKVAKTFGMWTMPSVSLFRVGYTL